MKKLILIPLILLLYTPSYATIVTIEDVPAYSWYHGCAPTAAASVLGYWDLNGYGGLFDASGSDVFLTNNVQEQISSTAHNLKYDSSPDDPYLPHPDDTSIADFMHTSEASRSYGSTYINEVPIGVLGYTSHQGYSDWYVFNGSMAFESLMAEIDAGRPMLGYVSTYGYSPNHLVSIVGYDDEAMMYGFYAGWSEDETIQWEPHHAINADPWGLSSITYIRPGEPDLVAPVPEPATIMLFGVGLLGIARINRKKH